MASTIKLKNGSGAPLAGDLVQGEPALDLTNKRLYTEDSGGNVIEVGTNPTSLTTGNITSSGTVSVDTIAEKTAANGVVVDGVTLKDGGITVTADVAFGDNDKAVFGAGSDLQIYHDGSDSYIQDSGTGDLELRGTNFKIGSATGSVQFIETSSAGLWTRLKYNSDVKLSTTSTGIDVTGTVTADGLTSSGQLRISGSVDTSSSGGITLKTGLISSSITNATDAFMGVNASGGIGTLAGDLVFAPRSSTGVAASIQLFSGQTTPKLRQKIADNGDISFYEDTGTTAKFFWDASAERLGIGETVLDEALVVRGGAYSANQNGGIALQLGSASGSHFKGAFKLKTDGSGVCRTVIESTDGTSGGTIEAISIPNGSGNVGIGTTSPVTTLDVNGGVNSAHATFSGQASRGLVISTANTLSNDDGVIYNAQTAGSGKHIWQTAGSERARIDSSGNLLVGKTSANVALAGTIINRTGDAYFTRDGSYPLYLNRLTSDGDIISLRKDGTTVGSIGTNGGSLYLGASDTGVRFSDSSDALVPFNTSTSANRDAAVSLGVSTVRFKDLYLSGGVYLGGTGAANLLDDYEEGNWTPVISDASTGGNTATYTNNFCTYTKVGRAVHLHINVSAINTTGMTAGNVIYIQNLPFVSVSTNRYIGTTQLNNVSITGVASSNIAGGLAYMRIHDTGTGSDILVSAITSGAGLIYADITYFTT